MECEPMLTPVEKSLLPEKFPPEEDRIRDADEAGDWAQLSYSGPGLQV